MRKSERFPSECEHTSGASEHLLATNDQWDRSLAGTERLDLLLDIFPLLRAFAIRQHWLVDERGNRRTGVGIEFNSKRKLVIEL